MAVVNGFNPNQFKEEWIINGIVDKEFIDYSEKMGKHLALLHGRWNNNEKRFEGEYRKNRPNNNLSTSQIRNFFGTLKTIEMKGFKENKEKFFMLKPLLAYAYQRNSPNEAFKDFKENVLDKALDLIMTEVDENKQKEYFKNFSNIFEAILAYHRANGGK